MNLPLDLTPLLLEFGASEVRYLVVGGHAVSIHAHPRFTKDLDLWLDPEAGNLSRAVAALQRFGAPPAICEALASARIGEVVWMGRVPARLDLLLGLRGLDDFDAAFRRRVTATIDGLEIPVIGRDDLIRNKEAVGRPQDRRDVRALRAVEGLGKGPGGTVRRRPSR